MEIFPELRAISYLYRKSKIGKPLLHSASTGTLCICGMQTLENISRRQCRRCINVKFMTI